MRFGFHALCDDLDIERMGHSDNGCGDGPAVLLRYQFPDESTVDLQVVHRHTEQLAQ
ncbi:MAG: hypothetical protein H7841_11780 [Magnetospirillum sp. WYHS-4]